MSRHKLSRLDILRYALEGAQTRQGVQSGNMSEEEEDDLTRDIEVLERRIRTEEVRLAHGDEHGTT